VYANEGDNLYVGGTDSLSSLVFVAPTGENTIIGGAEADTVYAVSSQKFVGGTGNLWFAGVGGSSTVLGGSGAATLYSAGTGSNIFYGGSNTLEFVGYGSSGTSTVVGGSGAETLYGVASNNVFAGGSGSESAWVYGGSDTFVGGSQAPYIYAVGLSAASTENISLIGTGSGAVVNDINVQQATINAAPDGGGDTFYMNAAAGNATIDASSLGQDTVWLVDPASASRTIELANWNKSDSITTFGYSAADQTALANAVSSGAASVTLSDQTTILFVPSKAV
jgi:Ca2+-binding RTX toxin-like protein